MVFIFVITTPKGASIKFAFVCAAFLLAFLVSVWLFLVFVWWPSPRCVFLPHTRLAPPPPPVQEYYANTGAMKAAADTLRAGKPGVACSIVEAFGGEPTPRDLEPRERCSAAAGEGDGEGKGQ